MVKMIMWFFKGDDFMRYFRKVIAVRDEWCEDGCYSWDFYKTIRDMVNDENYECSGCSLPIEDVKEWEY